MDADVARIRDNPLRRLLEKQRPYTLTRFVLLRLLGLVYFIAFLVAFQQMRRRLGTNGLLPADTFLEFDTTKFGSRIDAFRRLPTLLMWFGASDAVLLGMSALGMALSLAVVGGVTNAVVQFTLWLLYLSLSRVGQIFYGYGWEIQLLETGFLSIFLCPIREFRPFASAPPAMTMILFRWLIVRIMLGAGLIKLRGDPCWRDLTCLVYHYETQPIPSPLSIFFNELPVGAHKVGVAFNHLVELIAPIFAFWPRKARLIAGCLFVAFQFTLILSGNLSFLNWLTIVPAIACFDDDALQRILPKKLAYWFAEKPVRKPVQSQIITSCVATAFVAILSIEPVTNLFSERQRMNGSFNPLALVNTYG
ncbi:MAG TPA: lipase maturation factor family protein, partial [Polyangium sp.]|nr:lipase maturation factor family protein [Polyangium sp.]